MSAWRLDVSVELGADTRKKAPGKSPGKKPTWMAIPGKKPNTHEKRLILCVAKKNLRVDLGGRILGLSHNSAEAQKKMTLYERIKPSCLQKLNELQGEYPHLHESLIRVLKSTEFYVDMKYGDVLSLQDLVGEPVCAMFKSSSEA